MKYKILHVSGESISEVVKKLEAEVNKKLDEGWELQGGVAIDKGDPYCIYKMAQAMTKED